MTGVCPLCKAEPPKPPSYGAPIRVPGVLHKADCPTVPRLSPEQQDALRRDLAALAESRRAAMRDARNVWVG